MRSVASTKHVARYLAWRAAQKRARGAGLVSPRTVALDRAVLSRVFSYAVDMEYLAYNPVAAVPTPRSDPFEPVLLTPDQYEALLEACADRPMLALYVLLLAETGMRARSEALRLRWADVDLDGGFIRVRGRTGARNDGRTKSGKGRWVPMSARLAKAMREHFAGLRFADYDGVRPEYIFHHTATRRRGRKTHKAGERINDLRAAFNHAADRAKLPDGFRRHDLRHLRVTTWLAGGASPVLVKEAVGHADLATTMRYTHLVRDDLRALVTPAAAPATNAKAEGQ
jgi:integrase